MSDFREVPEADRLFLEHIIWYARRVKGKREDVADRLWRENPYVRLSDPDSLLSGWGEGRGHEEPER